MTDIQQVAPSARSAGRGFHAYSAKHLDTLTQRAGLSPAERLAVRAVATVLPFRTNSYVIEDLIATWRAMWQAQVRKGMVPYYMFVERDTGPQDYFAVPLARGYEIFRDAYQGVSGLGRTVRGPSMSATPGKVCVDGVTEVAGLQGLRPAHDPGA